MAQVLGHLKAKEFLLETRMIPVWDRFMAELRIAKAPLSDAQQLCIDELESLFDVAKLTPLRQKNWWKRNRPKPYTTVAKIRAKDRTELIKDKLSKAQVLARELGLDIVLRDRYYVLLEQGREVLHSMSASYFHELVCNEYKKRKKIKPRPRTATR